mmetsp:Transcript_47194/g.109139  ORF Transcript_47194/g.109139 Transcript_47194/m.109139 type:complete len:216 (+) Transcript_47194:601-1248(+)
MKISTGRFFVWRPKTSRQFHRITVTCSIPAASRSRSRNRIIKERPKMIVKDTIIFWRCTKTQVTKRMACCTNSLTVQSGKTPMVNMRTRRSKYMTKQKNTWRRVYTQWVNARLQRLCMWPQKQGMQAKLTRPMQTATRIQSWYSTGMSSLKGHLSKTSPCRSRGAAVGLDSFTTCPAVTKLPGILLSGRITHSSRCTDCTDGALRGSSVKSWGQA